MPSRRSAILRWQPPKGHAPWTNVLKATEFAPICALATTLGVFSGAPNNNEDCLYLNVFTPDLNPSARLPVIVWIHGGGNVDGETPAWLIQDLPGLSTLTDRNTPRFATATSGTR